jgi:V8-like Glu-specific endopeptidase
MPKDATHTYYSYSGDKPKWSPLRHAGSAARIIGDSVGFILGNAGTVAWCCSGVVIAENILLTNWHCGDSKRTGEMWTSEICHSTIVNLAWDEYPDTPGAQALRDREFLCEEVLSVDKFLDIAILKIAPLNGADTARPIPIRPGQLTDAETIDLIHHPGCEPKRVSASCQVNAINYANWQDPSRKTDLLHSCDSEAGSSGAGVFDKSGKLVALHHMGYQKKEGVCDYQNKAVSINEILQFVKDANPDISKLLNVRP